MIDKTYAQKVALQHSFQYTTIEALHVPDLEESLVKQYVAVIWEMFYAW